MENEKNQLEIINSVMRIDDKKVKEKVALFTNKVTNKKRAGKGEDLISALESNKYVPESIKRIFGDEANDLIFEKIIEIEGKVSNKEIKILEAKPELTLMNNNYYIGSLDYFLYGRIHLVFDAVIEDEWVWKNIYDDDIEFEIIIEFKPSIKSYSEVIRQINVYRRIKDCKHAVLITYDFDESMRKTFENQRIFVKILNESCQKTLGEIN